MAAVRDSAFVQAISALANWAKLTAYRKELVKLFCAIPRKRNHPRFLIPLYPRHLLKSTEECAPQAARQMRSPFTPVEAFSANGGARLEQAIYVDAEFCRECRPDCGKSKILAILNQIPPRDKAVEHLCAHIPREMVVADTRLAKFRIPWTGAFAQIS